MTCTCWKVCLRDLYRAVCMLVQSDFVCVCVCVTAITGAKVIKKTSKAPQRIVWMLFSVPFLIFADSCCAHSRLLNLKLWVYSTICANNKSFSLGEYFFPDVSRYTHKPNCFSTHENCSKFFSELRAEMHSRLEQQIQSVSTFLSILS